LHSAVEHPERARHAEMHDQHLAGRELGEQIFGAPAKLLDGRPDEAPPEIVRQRPAQVLAVGPDREERSVHHRGRQAPPHGFDLGQFRHVYTPSGDFPSCDSAPRARALWSGRPEPSMAETPDRQTDFGFREVPLAAKQELVDDVFRKVARRYDLMNDLMSGGLHRAWKDALVTAIDPPRQSRSFALLDLAGGTGDVAFRTLEAAGSGTRATVLDSSVEMLQVGRERAEARALDDVVRFVEGNAEHLPFPDRSYDAVAIAFGMRNVPRIERALAEAFRVLKPLGHFLCLEFS